MIPPLWILAIGLVTVIGMIIVLRVNAFVALITAAILVSLLAPGALGEKIARVAAAMGSTAGKIGIVIALAAIIGKCLMDSGAADRIVRAFLKVLGEKRAPEALMGGSFVLAIPVFFDTVFYLMVPLARSLYRQTRKNYMLYILAIATGGVITHGMVPPTPGPLFMAANLEIDLGVMILIGVMIGVPTGLVGLLFARLTNRLMKVPMRPYGDQPEVEPLDETELPPLWLALAPIALPVLLISANTVIKTWADEEHTPRFKVSSNDDGTGGDVKDWPGLVAALAVAKPIEDEDQDAKPSPTKELWNGLLEEARKANGQIAAGGELSDEFRQDVCDRLNRLLKRRDFYERAGYSTVVLPKTAKELKELLAEGVQGLGSKELDEFSSAEGRDLLGRGIKKLPLVKLERANRLLLEVSFPDQIEKHQWDTFRRQAAQVTAVLGNPNLALLFATAIALVMLARQRGLSLGELAKSTETALMSGGVIILITSAGGAFGAMLRTAGIRGAVEELFGSEGQMTGIALLLLGFGIASILKVAQGSGTVSMITTSAMMVGFAASPEQLPEMLQFHPAYLAIAIACGSHCGSWMNDSGFWIFARMSVLTEAEALKSWTIHLIVLAVVGMGFTLLAVSVLPLYSAT
jgi:H+/gluconate symporter-like permease